MRHLTQKRWKKILFGCGLIFLMALTLIVSRFNISPEDSKPLAAIQKLFGIHYSSSIQENESLRIIGHRGSGAINTTENTIAAIRHGKEKEVDWIEIDVRKAKDQLVLFHDKTLGSLNKNEKDTLTRDTSLKRFRDLQGEANPEHSIITLSELFQEFPSKDIKWVIDVKEPGIAKEVLEELNKHGFSKNNVIILGISEVIQEFKNCGYPLAYAAGWTEGFNRLKFLFGHSFISERCVELGSEVQHLFLPNAFVNRSLIEEVKRKKPGIQVWTYRGETPSNWHRSVGLGVDGIIVDNVDGAMKEFRKVPLKK